MTFDDRVAELTERAPGLVRFFEGMCRLARPVEDNCQRPECGRPWYEHTIVHDPPVPADAIEGVFIAPWHGLYCP